MIKKKHEPFRSLKCVGDHHFVAKNISHLLWMD